MKIRRRKPLNADRIVTLNCGLGRDSVMMLCLLIEGELVVDGHARRPREVDAVIFSDTGNEWPETYSVRKVVRDLCRAHGIRFEVVGKPDPEHYRPALMEDFRSRATVASLGNGRKVIVSYVGPWSSRMWKIGPRGGSEVIG